MPLVTGIYAVRQRIDQNHVSWKFHIDIILEIKYKPNMATICKTKVKQIYLLRQGDRES